MYARMRMGMNSRVRVRMKVEIISQTQVDQPVNQKASHQMKSNKSLPDDMMFIQKLGKVN